MGLVGGGSEAFAFVGFLEFVAPFEPVRLAVTFKRQDVGRDSIEELAIVASGESSLVFWVESR